MPKQSFQPPKGTRDFYPQDLLRRRYITETWRAVSIRHGFEEIDAPTFEHADLYAVKSGEGILSELFQAFSGKDESEIEQLRETGRAPYALRPEFTPSLARMYAARAKQLPKPTRWFSIPNFFRAEKPQRGRLREFFQWNCDIVGDGDLPRLDVEVVETIANSFRSLGLKPSHACVHVSHRNILGAIASEAGMSESKFDAIYAIADAWDKADKNQLLQRAVDSGLTPEDFAHLANIIDSQRSKQTITSTVLSDSAMRGHLGSVEELLGTAELMAWWKFDQAIVRGLAYYTGTVFEVIAEGERAVAGGGRYDNLIELFGGPSTPACGFGMGDVVLSNLLDDNDLFPSGPELMDAIARTAAQTSLRPEAFVVPASEEADQHIAPLLARLRRGSESEAFLARDDRKPWHADRYCAQSNGVRPVHARTTDKATRNLKKLLADAQKQFARLCVIIHEPDKVQLKDFDANQDLTPADIPALSDAARNCAEFSLDPAAPDDIARAIVALLDR